MGDRQIYRNANSESSFDAYDATILLLPLEIRSTGLALEQFREITWMWRVKGYKERKQKDMPSMKDWGGGPRTWDTDMRVNLR